MKTHIPLCITLWAAASLASAYLENNSAFIKKDATSDDMHSTTPLHRAALSGDTKAAVILLQNGADIEARNSAGATPLICAVQYAAKEKSLIQAARENNLQDVMVPSSTQTTEKDNTPYFYAVKTQNESCIRSLIEAGANPEHKNSFERTAEEANL